MDGLIFNFNYCINPYVESLLVHCSYLIGNRTIAAGSTRQSHFNFNDLSVSFEVKLKLLTQKDLPAFSRQLPVIVADLAEVIMPGHSPNLNPISLKKSILID